MSSKLYSLADFRDEMKRRGVYDRNEPRLLTRSERAQRRAKNASRRMFGESELDRVVRAVGDIRRTFYAEIIQAIRARLAELTNKAATTRFDCPWLRFDDHDDGCRHCKGSGRMSVGAMRSHCLRMLGDYRGLA